MRRAGIATNVSPSSYGEVTVRRPGVDPHHVGADARADRQERQPVGGRVQPPHEHRLVDLHQLEGARSGGPRGSAAPGGSSRAWRRARPACGSCRRRRAGRRPGRRTRSTVRSVTGERSRARTSAIGLRREPQPPMPMVMPLLSRATTSSGVMVLSVTARPPRSARVLERVADPVGDAAEVGLEGEALLEAVAAAYVDRVDAVDGGLGEPDQRAVLAGDLARQLQCGVRQFIARHHLPHRAVGVQLLGRRGARGVVQRAHEVLRDEAGEVGGGAERAAVQLGQAEDGVVARHDRVRVAGQADAAAQAEPADRRDDRHLALVHRGEGLVAAAVGADEGGVAAGRAASP